MKATVSILNSVTEPVQPESDTEKGALELRKADYSVLFCLARLRKGKGTGKKADGGERKGTGTKEGKKDMDTGRTERRKVRRKDRK